MKLASIPVLILLALALAIDSRGNAWPDWVAESKPITDSMASGRNQATEKIRTPHRKARQGQKPERDLFRDS